MGEKMHFNEFNDQSSICIIKLKITPRLVRFINFTSPCPVCLVKMITLSCLPESKIVYEMEY